jgi:hypothetical protein
VSGRRGWRPRAEPPAFDRGSHPPALLARLVGAWQRLCEDERDSIIAATLAAADLARLGAPAHIMGAAARVIEDEVRHVDVCTRVLDRLGAVPVEQPVASRRATLGDDAPIAARCARILIAGFAVSEPMSAACFAAARRRATEPLFRWALTELLRDEARHGPFGIAAGRWVVTGWSSAARRALWPACVAEMESFERLLGGPIPPGPNGDSDSERDRTPTAPLVAVGLLSPSDNCAAALACIPRWVLPPLARLGIALRAAV